MRHERFSHIGWNLTAFFWNVKSWKSFQKTLLSVFKTLQSFFLTKNQIWEVFKNVQMLKTMKIFCRNKTNARFSSSQGSQHEKLIKLSSAPQPTDIEIRNQLYKNLIEFFSIQTLLFFNHHKRHSSDMPICYRKKERLS